MTGNLPKTAAIFHTNNQINPAKVPKTRIELHCHLASNQRHETLYELMSKRCPEKLPGDGTFRTFVDSLIIRQPTRLGQFLEKLLMFSPCLANDASIWERIAYEYSEECARSGILYFETRTGLVNMWTRTDQTAEDRKESLRECIRAILKGLKRGEDEFGSKGRLILNALRRLPEQAMETVEFCHEFRDKGVVGIDITDEEKLPNGDVQWWRSPELIAAFTKAKDLGIRRTIHCAEDGPGKNIQYALDVLHAERIGHGYRILEAPDVYQRVLTDQVHLECCPYSSLLTGAVPLHTKKHPIVRFAEDGANFSLNRDDNSITFSSLQDEYDLVTKWGLTEAHIVKANFDALDNSFLPDDEKAELRKKLERTLGIKRRT